MTLRTLLVCGATAAIRQAKSLAHRPGLLSATQAAQTGRRGARQQDSPHRLEVDGQRPTLRSAQGSTATKSGEPRKCASRRHEPPDRPGGTSLAPCSPPSRTPAAPERDRNASGAPLTASARGALPAMRSGREKTALGRTKKLNLPFGGRRAIATRQKPELAREGREGVIGRSQTRNNSERRHGIQCRRLVWNARSAKPARRRPLRAPKPDI